MNGGRQRTFPILYLIMKSRNDTSWICYSLGTKLLLSDFYRIFSHTSFSNMCATLMCVCVCLCLFKLLPSNKHAICVCIQSATPFTQPHACRQHYYLLIFIFFLSYSFFFAAAIQRKLIFLSLAHFYICI